MGDLEICEQQVWSTSTLVKAGKIPKEKWEGHNYHWMCSWTFSAQRKQVASSFLRSSFLLCTFAAKSNAVLVQAATSVVTTNRNSHSGRFKMELILAQAGRQLSDCKVHSLWRVWFESSMILILKISKAIIKHYSDIKLFERSVGGFLGRFR